MVVTSTAAANVSADTGTFAIVMIITLVILLATKEIVSAITNEPLALFNRHLNLGILPLLMVFASVEIVEIAEIL